MGICIFLCEGNFKHFLDATSPFNNWLLLQGFITDNERALEDLFGDEESSRRGDACLNVMGTRIATVFASLRVCHLNPLRRPIA